MKPDQKKLKGSGSDMFSFFMGEPEENKDSDDEDKVFTRATNLRQQ